MAKRSHRNDEPDAGSRATDLRGRIKSDFPKHPLTAAVRLAKAIEETNGGKPVPPTDLAIAIGISPGSSDYRVLLSSSMKYGLTSGSYKQERISLTSLGGRLAAPVSEEDRRSAESEAALMPATFRGLYDYFRGKKLPDSIFFQNTLVRDFDVPREHAERCAEIFVENMEKIGLVRTAATGKWLSTEQLLSPSAPQISARSEHDPAPDITEGSEPLNEPVQPNIKDARQKPDHSAIFLGHGKNKKPLEQLKHILDHYRIPYRVAVEQANQFRPISEKVADTMRECGAAILIFTADEEFKTAEGNSTWRPSENVVHELGAASILYGGRIIIFKEDGVTLPTNFSGIGYITFPKDELATCAHDLFRELVSFGLIKISVGA